MKIMVVGGGGREHAIIKKLGESPKVDKIYALPGNGGIAADAECVAIGAKDLDGITKFAVDNKIDFAVVAPDDPLVLGAVDRLEAVGVPCFGPRANAAIIEGSKIFSKNLMKKYGIPTAAYEVFTEADAALDYLKDAPIPTVIKADGLALGKGVVIAMTRDEAIDVLTLVSSSEDADEATKADAQAKISRIATDIQNEANIETLVKAKGFEECVALISDGAVSVIVKAETLQAKETAQILSIVYETTGIAPENVSIINK